MYSAHAGEDNVRHGSVLQHKCLMNTQASAEGAKSLHHEKDKQTWGGFFEGAGEGLVREDATHKHFCPKNKIFLCWLFK